MAMNISQAKEHIHYLYKHARELYESFSPIKKALMLIGAGCMAIGGIIFIIFHNEFFALLVAFSKKWKEMPGGGILMFLSIFVISFPPLIGYSTLSSLIGMMYGFPWGWPFLVLATLVGSTASFLTSRYLLSDYAKRLAQTNTKFAALTSAMEKDSFTLLWMIRLCPLPYSFSNGALSTIHSVSAIKFFAATALTSPKLLIHIFIGDRLTKLGTEKDTASKIVDFISIGLAAVFGTLTAYTIYNRTMQHVAILENREYSELEDGGLAIDTNDFEVSDDE